ncbi:MAG: FHA domain-containing protein [Hyphomicrobiaceae bacterium]|nr:FHA domain-containing protein [Hyphomicrobiaceae bacterium]
MAAVPVLLLAGVVVRARSRAAGPDPGGLTRIVRNPGKADKDAIGGTVGEPNTGRVTKAWRNAARPPAAMLIRVLEGDPEPGREIALGDLRVLRIGRETDNDICLRNETVHRYHAVISRSPDDGLVVSDLSGRTGNGVYVNGSRVTSQPLVDGDRLVLGRAELLVVMR